MWMFTAAFGGICAKKSCTSCGHLSYVCHRYDKSRPEREYRDHDNIEMNAIIDALALYTLYDDAPLRCEHHYCSLTDDRDATTILLVPQPEFPVCYERIKTDPQTLLPLFP